MTIEQNRFRTNFDARHFDTHSVTITLNGKDVTYPCATLRHCSMNGGKMSTEKVLIFFADEVAELFNNWMSGFLTKSKVTGRWYMTLDISEDVADERGGKGTRLRKFLRNAAEKSYLTDTEFPIRQMFFKLQVIEQRQFGHQAPAKPVLADILECKGAFESESLKPKTTITKTAFDICEEETNVRKKEKTVRDVWETFTEDQKNTVYFMIGKALEDKGIEIPIPAPQKASILKIIFNGPATVVFWTDGTKTIVRYNDETEVGDDREKAVFAACAKKLMGTNKTGSNYLDRIKPAFDEAQAEWAKRIAKKEGK